MRARRMAREAAREAGQPKGARIERGANAGGKRFARPVEALPRPFDQRFPARQRARERAQVGPAPLGRSAASRPAAVPRVRPGSR